MRGVGNITITITIISMQLQQYSIDSQQKPPKSSTPTYFSAERQLRSDCGTSATSEVEGERGIDDCLDYEIQRRPPPPPPHECYNFNWFCYSLSGWLLHRHGRRDCWRKRSGTLLVSRSEIENYCEYADFFCFLLYFLRFDDDLE